MPSASSRSQMSSTRSRESMSRESRVESSVTTSGSMLRFFSRISLMESMVAMTFLSSSAPHAAAVFRETV